MKAAYEHLRQFALGFPEAHEEFPWGECAVKVRGKTFLFMSIDETGLRLETDDFALRSEAPEGSRTTKSKVAVIGTDIENTVHSAQRQLEPIVVFVFIQPEHLPERGARIHDDARSAERPAPDTLRYGTIG